MTGMFQSAPHFSSEANFAVRLFRAFLKDVSIRASLQQRGEHGGRPGQWRRRAVSIRASLQQRGEHNRTRHSHSPNRVSIRASLQQRGEPSTRNGCLLFAWFQSAPHFSSEANASSFGSTSIPTSFNPRLTSAARRTASSFGSTSIPTSFNPRLTSAARRTSTSAANSDLVFKFQSAPHFSSEANR